VDPNDILDREECARLLATSLTASAAIVPPIVTQSVKVGAHQTDVVHPDRPTREHRIQLEAWVHPRFDCPERGLGPDTLATG
jgi:hypothetical protein